MDWCISMSEEKEFVPKDEDYDIPIVENGKTIGRACINDQDIFLKYDNKNITKLCSRYLGYYDDNGHFEIKKLDE